MINAISDSTNQAPKYSEIILMKVFQVLFIVNNKTNSVEEKKLIPINGRNRICSFIEGLIIKM